MTDAIHKEYGNNPLLLFNQWLEEAGALEPSDPEAFCLATADTTGTPSARMLLLKEANESGFKFHTNSESRKGREISVNARAEMCFYWKSTRKQVRVRGTVAHVDPTETDAYFATRPRGRQIGAWASRQSEPLESPETLDAAVKRFEAEFGNRDIPRPPNWNGYRLVPDSIEFWIGQKDRLHTRFVYTRTAASRWDALWLNP